VCVFVALVVIKAKRKRSKQVLQNNKAKAGKQASRQAGKQASRQAGKQASMLKSQDQFFSGVLHRVHTGAPSA
jgi:hypothetical protein